MATAVWARTTHAWKLFEEDGELPVPDSNLGHVEPGSEDQTSSPVLSVAKAVQKEKFRNLLGVRYEAKRLENGLRKNLGSLFVWGDNQQGQLGLSSHLVQTSKSPAVMDALTECGVIHVDTCSNHSAAVLDDGSVVCWGENNKAQLGVLSAESMGPLFVTLPASAAKIIQVACGTAFCASLSETGLVYSWGANEYLQLGHRRAAGFATAAPALVDEIKNPAGEIVRIKKIACGGEYTAAISAEDSLVWTWGRNDLGQLGHGKVEIRGRPRQLHVRVPFTQVSCGVFHTAGVTPEGDVWTWGLNDSGQLGLGHKNSTCVPSRVEALGGGAGLSAGVLQVAAGLFYTLAVADSGRVYAWGCGDQGQLGCGEGIKESSLPLKISGLSRCVVSYVAAAEGHSAAITVDGHVYAWGRHDSGRIGVAIPPGVTDANAFIEWTPRLVHEFPAHKAATMVCLGDFHSIVLSNGGKGFQFSQISDCLMDLQDCIKDLRDLVENYRRPLLSSVETSRLVITKEQIDGVFGDSESLLLFLRSLLLALLDVSAQGRRIGSLVLGGGRGSFGCEEWIDNRTWESAPTFLSFCQDIRSMSKVYLSCRHNRRFRRFCDHTCGEIGRSIGELLFCPKRHVGIIAEILRRSTLDLRSTGFAGINANTSFELGRSGVGESLLYKTSPSPLLQSAPSYNSGVISGILSSTKTIVPQGDGPQFVPDRTSDRELAIIGLQNADKVYGFFSAFESDQSQMERPPSSPGSVHVIGATSPDIVPQNFAEEYSFSFKIERKAENGGVSGWLVTISMFLFVMLTLVRVPFLITHIYRRVQRYRAFKAMIRRSAHPQPSVQRHSLDFGGDAEPRRDSQATVLRDVRVLVVKNAAGAVSAFEEMGDVVIDLLGREAYLELGNIWASCIALVLGAFSPLFILFLSQLGAFSSDGSLRAYITGFALALYFWFLFGSTLILIFRVRKSGYSHKLTSRARSLRLNMSNSLAIMCLLIECWQVNAIAFSPTSNVPFPKLLLKIFPIAFLTGDYFAASFFTLALALIILIPIIWILVSELSPVLKKGSFSQVVISFWLAPIIMGPLYMIALVHIFSSLSCTYSPRRATSYLDISLEKWVSSASLYMCSNSTAPPVVGTKAHPRYYHSTIIWDQPSSSDKSYFQGDLILSLCSAVECWEPIRESGLSQSVLGLVALYAFALYYPAATHGSLPRYFLDPDLDLRHTPMYSMIVQVSKALMAFFFVFLSRYAFPYLIIAFALNLFLAFYSLRKARCSIRWVSYWRPLSFALASWSSLVSLTSSLVFEKDPSLDPLPDSLTPFLILIMGWALLLFLWTGYWLNMRKTWSGAKLAPSDLSMELSSGSFEVSGALERQIATKRRWFDIPGVSPPPTSLIAPRVRTTEILGGFSGGTAMSVLVGSKVKATQAILPGEKPAKLPPMKVHGGGLAKITADPHWRSSEMLNLSYQELGYLINIDELTQTLREAVNLKSLILIGNSITTLQTVWLPFLTAVDLSNNKISSFAQLPKAPSLQSVNLSQNRIPPSAAAVKNLSRYKKLESLFLRGNPLAFSPDYKKLILKYCPESLTMLDDRPLRGNESDRTPLPREEMIAASAREELSSTQLSNTHEGETDQSANSLTKLVLRSSK